MSEKETFPTSPRARRPMSHLGSTARRYWRARTQSSAQHPGVPKSDRAATRSGSNAEAEFASSVHAGAVSRSPAPNLSHDVVARWAELGATSLRSRETATDAHRLRGRRGRDHHDWHRSPRLRSQIAGRDTEDELTRPRDRPAQLQYPDVSATVSRKREGNNHGDEDHPTHPKTDYAARAAEVRAPSATDAPTRAGCAALRLAGCGVASLRVVAGRPLFSFVQR